MQIRLLSAGLLALSLVTGCLSTSEPIVIPTIETTGFDPSLGVNLAGSTKTADGLYYRDITTGTGITVIPGDTVGIYYSGALATGKVFDSRDSTSTLGPFSFVVGANQVIQGFDEGMVGMKVGGKRQLIIPSSLAYGSDSRFDSLGNLLIPSYSILVFTVTLVSAK
jgi:FKBP-type peptidyl-prolyl cis-trans isomerase FkpA